MKHDLKRLGEWLLGLLDIGDALLVLIGAGVLAVASWTGFIEGTEKLIAATLTVLAAVGLAILRERFSRRRVVDEVRALAAQSADTHAAVQLLVSGNQYRVLHHETVWDIASKDGSLVYAARNKKIRFEQNNVVSIPDIAVGSGTREIDYGPGRKAVHEYLFEGKVWTLVALDKVHFRGEVIDFDIKRTAHNAFERPHEDVNVLTRDVTDFMRLKVMWHPERPPKLVRLCKTSAGGEPKVRDVTAEVRTENGRRVYTHETHEPQRGSSTTIEWDW